MNRELREFIKQPLEQSQSRQAIRPDTLAADAQYANPAAF